MNNKGQTLVAFLLVLPFLCLLCGFLFDLGLIQTEKRRMDNVVKDTIQYALTHQEENIRRNIEVLLNQNLDDVTVKEILIDDNKVEISISKKQKSLYSIMMGKKIYTIKTYYKGYMTEEGIKFTKE